ncbi:thioesterase family protein [Streptomyces sp. 796.1]|uniref:thioesterase family protein n=1 Tax=Streptomyces sp. 796.1 TaxID=3163029 RepID=UPI0039C8DEF0
MRRGASPHVFDGRLCPEWKSDGRLTGSILLTMAARAAARTMHVETEKFFPSVLSACFLSPAQPGPVTVRADVLRSGSRITTGQASLSQCTRDGQYTERMRALITHGKFDDRPVDAGTTPPHIPAPDDCVGRQNTPARLVERLDMVAGLDVRLSPGCVGWLFDSPARSGRFDGWVRLADGQPPDPMLLLVAIASLPPISFDFGQAGWLPMVQLTAHIRAKPAPGWLQVSTSTQISSDQSVVEDAEVWDAEGTLVVQSRQFAAPT